MYADRSLQFHSCGHGADLLRARSPAPRETYESARAAFVLIGTLYVQNAGNAGSGEARIFSNRAQGFQFSSFGQTRPPFANPEASHLKGVLRGFPNCGSPSLRCYSFVADEQGGNYAPC